MITTNENIEDDIPDAGQLADIEDHVRECIEQGSVDLAAGELFGLRPPVRRPLSIEARVRFARRVVAKANAQMTAMHSSTGKPSDAVQDLSGTYNNTPRNASARSLTGQKCRSPVLWPPMSFQA